FGICAGWGGTTFLTVLDDYSCYIELGRHSRTYVSRSSRGVVPVPAVAFAGRRSLPAFFPLCAPLWSLTGTSTKLPHTDPLRELGSAALGSLLLTWSVLSPVGG